VTLKRKTRNGDTALVILTNLPIEVADAMTIAACYRARWGIEISH
jgi:IS4 transposase